MPAVCVQMEAKTARACSVLKFLLLQSRDKNRVKIKSHLQYF